MFIGAVDTSVDLGVTAQQATGHGNDTLTGIENVTTGDGNDAITGNGLANVLTAGAGDDMLDGGAGDDVLHGGDGNDTLDGGTGDDELNGGDGDDTILVAAGSHIVDSGDGHDILDSRGREAGVDYYVDFTNIEEMYASNVASSSDWTPVSIGLIYHGGVDRDTVVAGSGADWIDGAKGRDDLSGGDGDEVLIGGNGRDVLSGGRGKDDIDAGNGNDTVDGAAAAAMSFTSALAMTGWMAARVRTNCALISPRLKRKACRWSGT